MSFKINISDKTGKTYKLETEDETLTGKKVGEVISGKILQSDLADYELEITGASDKAGFPAFKEVSGVALKRVLLKKGKGLHKRPKGDKKKKYTPKGIKLRKTVRGNTLSRDTIQINMKVTKVGSKPLKDIFNKAEPVETTESPEQKSETKEQNEK